MSPTAPTIALFAHPDDEIGLYPWIEAAVRDGRRVQCVYLTDGGWGGQDVARRCGESRRVLERIGVPSADVHFPGVELAIPDGGLCDRIADAVAWLDAHFADCGPGTRLWLPAWEGGHPDHDATHLAGLALARRRGIAAGQYPLYHGKGLPGPWFRVITPIDDNGPVQGIAVSAMDRIRCVLRCFSYRSQWKSFIGLLPFYALRMLQPRPFGLQAVEWARTAQRPHAGKLLYERRGGPTWDEFAARTAAWRAPG